MGLDQLSEPDRQFINKCAQISKYFIPIQLLLSFLLMLVYLILPVFSNSQILHTIGFVLIMAFGIFSVSISRIFNHLMKIIKRIIE